MSFKIAIASGKGGTGKTTVAVNLYQYIASNICEEVALYDCDVEEPNDIIFYPDAEKMADEMVFQKIPEIKKQACTFCRECATYCEFNAIVIIPSAEFAEVNASLCHSCGACKVACKYDAIQEKNLPIGEICYYQTKKGLGIVEGILKIGSAMQTAMIRELKKKVLAQPEVIIYDAPPGTSCPVVQTITDCDYLILVTEPTPFGFHDLKLMLELVKELDIPCGVIINKAGIGNDEVYSFLHEKKIDILGEIPFSKGYAVQYSNGKLFMNTPKEIEKNFRSIFERIQKGIEQYEGNNYFKW